LDWLEGNDLFFGKNRRAISFDSDGTTAPVRAKQTRSIRDGARVSAISVLAEG
jgi:hypothetical protein